MPTNNAPNLYELEGEKLKVTYATPTMPASQPSRCNRGENP